MYRTRLRCGIVKFIAAGRAKLAKLWSGRHHLLYGELEMADTIKLAIMPNEVKDLLLNTASLNLSGKPHTGEGADFRLEEVNRQVQQWLPNIPSTKDWQIACCNFDKLTALRKTVFDQMKLTDTNLGTEKYVQDIDEEVMVFRAKLRENEYLMKPGIHRPHKSLDGRPLDEDLKNICKISRDKRAKYAECYLNHEKNLDKASHHPLKSIHVL